MDKKPKPKPKPKPTTKRRTTKRRTLPLWYRRLRKLGACSEALQFARNCETFAGAWRACDNRYWIVWLLNDFDLGPKHTDSGCWCFTKNVDYVRGLVPLRDVSAALSKVKL